VISLLTRYLDVFIERDSRKDEAVVFIFIFATGGLLAWALLKPWIERYIEVRQKRLQTEMRNGKKKFGAIGTIRINCFFPNLPVK
jgi:hypothetical protein